MSRLCLAFCSTSRMPTPASRTRGSAWNSSPHSAATGRATARRAAGFRAPTSARGRSPPSAARRRSWCARPGPGARRGAGTARARARDSRASSARARCAIGAEREVLAHRQVGEDAASLRHQRDARLDDLVRRERGEVAPAEADARRRRAARTRPAITLSSVILPAPLAPRMTTISPLPDVERDAARAPRACRRRRRGRRPQASASPR